MAIFKNPPPPPPPSAFPRWETTPEFSKPGFAYCLALAPPAFWVERPDGSRVETYCCLGLGHREDHRWALRFRAQEPGQPLEGEAEERG